MNNTSVDSIKVINKLLVQLSDAQYQIAVLSAEIDMLKERLNENEKDEK